MGHWCENEDYEDLPDVEVGDIVHFKLEDTFSYCVKAIIDVVEDSTVIATVETIFDWDSGGQITSGSVLDLEGEELELGYEYIHNVISR